MGRGLKLTPLYPGAFESVMYVELRAMPEDIRTIIEFAQARGRLTSRSKAELDIKYPGGWTQQYRFSEQRGIFGPSVIEGQ